MRTIAVWSTIMMMGAALVLTGPEQGDYSVVVALMRSVGAFAAVLAFFVGRTSGTGEGRILAYFYSLFFSVQVLLGFTSLADTMQIGELVIFYLTQYEHLLYMGLLLLVCAYVLGGALLPIVQRPLRIAFAMVVAATIIGPTGLPYIINPKYLYTRPDITDFRILDRAMTELQSEGVANPNPGDVSKRIALSHWKEFKRIGELSAEEELTRTEKLFPYLQGNNYIALLFRPLYAQYALQSLLCIILLTVFFAMNFLRDPPKPAHFEKIHFTLLVFVVFEYFHAATLAKTTTFEQIVALDRIGKYLTTIILVFFIGFLIARLRFLCMSVGAFYEERLNGNPGTISRWRDGVDNFLLRQFLAEPRLRKRFIARRLKE